MKILLIAFGVLICYALQKFLYCRFWNYALKITLSLSDKQAVEGDRVILWETVENRKLLPLFMIIVKFKTSKYFNFMDKDNSSVSDSYYRKDILSVFALQRITRELPFTCTKRGYYTIDELQYSGSDLFFTKSYINTINCGLNLYVYPRYCECEDLDTAFLTILGEILNRHSLYEDPFEFRGIREYQSFDTMNAVNWKATAKTQELKVNLADHTAKRQLRIFLNLEDESSTWKYDYLKEESIRIAATLSDRFLRGGIPLTLCSNGKDILENSDLDIPMGTGKQQIRAINEALARIDLSRQPEGFLGLYRNLLESKSREDYTIFISTFKHNDFIQMLLSLLAKKQAFLWICPLDKSMELNLPAMLLPHTLRLNITP